MSSVFLDDLLGPDGDCAVGQLTPGQLVHGQETAVGDDNVCSHWKEGEDPHCIWSLTLELGVIFVETLISTAEVTGDQLLTHSADGAPYFGDAVDFVSYTLHGTT